MAKRLSPDELIELHKKYSAIAESQGILLKKAMTLAGFSRKMYEKTVTAARGGYNGYEARVEELLERHKDVLRRREAYKTAHPGLNYDQVNKAVGLTKQEVDNALRYVKQYDQDFGACLISVQIADQYKFALGVYSVWKHRYTPSSRRRCCGWFSTKKEAEAFVEDRLFGLSDVTIVPPGGTV